MILEFAVVGNIFNLIQRILALLDSATGSTESAVLLGNSCFHIQLLNTGTSTCVTYIYVPRELYNGDWHTRSEDMLQYASLFTNKN